MQPGPRDGFHRIHHLGTGLGLRIAVSEEGRYGYSYDEEGDAREKALTECANRTTEESVCEITECDENDQSISSRSDAASAGNALGCSDKLTAWDSVWGANQIQR